MLYSKAASSRTRGCWSVSSPLGFGASFTPRVDAEALQLDDTSRVPTISSAGCNVLNYLTHEPEQILTVDVSATHMALTRLRIAALRYLPDHEAFVQFFGVGTGRENAEAYHRHLRPHLREATRQFWDAWPLGGLRRPPLHAFEEGFYERGVFPRFRGLASLVPKMRQGHRAEELLDATNHAE